MRLLEYAAHYDLVTFGWLHQRDSQRLLVPIAKKISFTADGYFYSFLILYSLVSSHWGLFQLSVATLVLERIIYFFLKNSCKRNRPPQVISGFQSIITASDKFSFPSGHTSAAFMLATLVYLINPALGAFLYPWAASVAVSRVVLGVHFPTDTLAGAILGSSMAAIGYSIFIG
ncbi:phosphatase PAP2 family protein [Aurantivibrio plasticivorans]